MNKLTQSNMTPRDAYAYECRVCYATFQPDKLPEDGRCDKCEERPNLTPKDSEFGAGIVVCLAKFSEHLWTDQERTINELVGFQKTGRRDNLGERARRDLEWNERYDNKYWREKGQSDVEHTVTHAIEMWASGASDHFYDLDDSAPAPLKELAELTLSMGHGFTGKTWTAEDWEQVRKLWRSACLAVDDRLGVRSNWGEY